ncbi:cytochrome c-type biogenesis protein CcmE homolog, mitochondrial [Diospyros lotus]|uniref:cytochrome c-type biogenesis protein CcmE homolog, mitochondrial n=1 Tax=Diospyros lotus TaxID=55363 RepID=UPI00224E489E|nr:cytochrome c-type biogenesis protein CcmE homolog, mitochondrial [Diospyros lotus]
MACALSSRFAARLLRRHFHSHHHHPPIFSLSSNFPPSISSAILQSEPSITASDLPLGFRFFSIARRQPVRSNRVDIGARARQLQQRRLWTYALTFSCIAGFVVIVLNNFQDQLVFYVTPTDALAKYNANPTKNKFRLGGLVLEGSVAHPANSTEMEFVITDLITDILVRYQGSLPDLFREGHSVVVEGFVKPIPEEIKREVPPKNVSGKARSGECYFAATEVLAKHDEKYMPQEVAAAIEKNKRKIEAGGHEEEIAKS